MRENLLRLASLLFGAVLGVWITASVLADFFRDWSLLAGFRLWIVGAFFGATLGVIAFPWLYWRAWHGLEALLSRLQKTPGEDLIVATGGLVVGLVVALLVSLPLPLIPWIGRYLPVVVTVLSAYFGAALALRKKDELLRLSPWKPARRAGREPERRAGVPKVLDTSAIIDGRIADVAATGFLEGPLVIPGFVIQELQRLADSSEELKRNRGRRGLDLLNRMRKDPTLSVDILEDHDTGGRGVDLALVRLARRLGGKVVTNDYNLNKVAQLHGVSVLNLNDLANATRPVVLPGEEMEVRVIRDGKEQGQGVGYLDDGTMIVVDGGRQFIGGTVGVTVTSVLQTSAGRMIFARPKVREQGVTVSGVQAASG